ncbi:MAG: hypothetical protein ABSB80_09925 [Methanoregula sp.]|uniref:hypothetical protein n=1 Tax=Methanoregula sp. TaxID=2052170 RepID=UPI003D09E72E
MEPGIINNIGKFESRIAKERLDYIHKYPRHLAKIVIVNDKKKENGQDASPWLFVFLFADQEMKCPCEIIAFYTGTPSYIYLGTVGVYEVEKKGIVRLGINEIPSDDYEYQDENDFNKQKIFLMKETFYAVRDLYHKHTHHVNDGNNDEVPDSLTLPSFLAETDRSDQDDKYTAVRNIIQYYQEKIVEYNNYICDFIIKSQDQSNEDEYLINSTGLLRQAKGCFIYGNNLLELYPKAFTDEEYKYSQKMFVNATLAVQAFWDEINTRYNARISGNSKRLALNSNLLALLIIMFSVLSLFDRYLNNSGPVFLFIPIVLIVVFGCVAFISIREQVHVK